MIATATAVATKVVRVAIYTRVSTADQAAGDFSSLDNQRESGEAYARAHAAEGWQVLATRYDDGGFSGSTTERPALQRLLRDIDAGKVDCVVVYKVDRLSRSLLDFARMAEQLERRGVSFVSVTQQFDTSTSMGKLMQNVLMSFAQFERETIAERTRDKVVAARRRGKWTGGTVILGYDLVDGKLVPNAEEVPRLSAIFALYLEHGSLREVVAILRERRWLTKSWVTRRGHARRSREFDTAALHRLLRNPVYIGKVLCQGQLHAGEHEAIIEQATWDRVQRLLATNGTGGGAAARNKTGALLTGILRCRPCDAAMIHTHTRKGSRLYRYYVCGAAQRNGWDTCPTKSLPAAELERVIVEKIRCIGRDPELVRATLEAARAQRAEQMRLLASEIVGAEREVKALRAAATRGNGNGHGEEVDARHRAVEEAEQRLAGLQAEYVAVGQAAINPDELAHLLAEFDPIWDVLHPKERARVVRLLVQEVDYDGTDGVVGITFAPVGIKALSAEAAGQGGEKA